MSEPAAVPSGPAVDLAVDPAFDIVALLADGMALPGLLPPVTSVEMTGHPGGIVALRHAGQVAMVGLGLADLDHAVPIGQHTVFDCASIAKPFTAAAVLELCATTDAQLDDTLTRYLPELGATFADVRLRHLLFHTSGIRDYQLLLALAGARRNDYFGAADVLSLLGRQRSLSYRCGSRHLYSNSNYFLLAQVVQRASSGSFASFLAETVLRPAGLERTRVRDDQASIVAGRARSYAWRDGSGYRLEHTPTDIVGDSGLLATADDLLKWTGYLRAELGRPGSPLAAMARPGTLDDGQPISYGYGLQFKRWGGQPGFGHGGSFDGYRAEVVLLLDWELDIVVLANWSGADPARVVDALVEGACARLDEAPAAASAEPGERDAPGWPPVLIDDSGLPWELRAGKAGRVVLLNPEVQVVLESETPDLLVGHWDQDRVTVRRDGGDFGITIGPRRFGVRPNSSNPPNPTSTAGLAGTYWSDELMTRAVVSVQGGELRWRRRSAAETLEWVAADVFRAGGTWVVFQRDPTDSSGVAAALELLTPRASGLVFRRVDQPG